MWSLLILCNVILFLALALYGNIVKKIFKFIRLIEFSRTIPGPPITEAMGNISKERILPWFTENAEKYGTVFRVWFGTDLLLFFSDPDDIKAILSSNTLLYKSSNYKLVHDWLGNGLLTNGGETWHKRRKMLTPAFHFRILSAFQQPMEDNCKILINKLSNVADGVTSINIYPFITLFAMDVICETAMGIKKNAQIKSDSEYVKAVQKMCEILQYRIFNSWYRFPFIFQFTQLAKESKEALKVLHGETWRLIDLRRKMLEKEQLNLNEIDSRSEKDNSIGSKKRLAFLDMLLLSQKEGVPLTDKEIREEVDTFMFEGHDTTSSAISFTLYLLSQHPEVQQKAYEEIIQCEEHSKDTMKYLDAVIKESLRMFPSVPSFSRIVNEDFKLRNMTIPEGASVAVFAYMAHRQSKHYPNPNKFIPERFLDFSQEFHPYSFVPFSAGPRNCIGQKFAMLELKCTLSNLMRNFEFLPADNFEIKPFVQLILKSANGVYLKIRKRG